MKIGIPKEIRRNESRVSMVPDDVAKLVQAGHQVYVERTAGVTAGFHPADYEKANAIIIDSIEDCDLVVSVKAPAVNRMREGVTLMAYLHVEKGQNADLLSELKRKRILSYAFEEIRNRTSERLVNLGFEAGIVGIAEGLRILGGMLKNAGKTNMFGRLKHVREYGSRKGIYSDIAKLNGEDGINVIIMGKGCVSRGVQDLLRQTSINPQVLWRRETANIEDYLSHVDILVNAVDWYPDEPHILKKSMLKRLKKTTLIVDISCDRKGAVETCVPTTWEAPVYEINGISHFCVSNLPGAIPRDSSIRLSSMILPHVTGVANGQELNTGMMTRNGEFVYKKAVSS